MATKKTAVKKASPKKTAAKTTAAKKTPGKASAAASPVHDATGLQGVALVERCIDVVREKGFVALGTKSIKKPVPVPASALEALRFPDGQRPSPSLLRWLAFDGAWLASLGWFEDPAKPAFRKVTIGAFADQEYDLGGADGYGRFERVLPGSFYILPLGADSRRALYVGKPDSTGEHPVAVTDNDELPFVGLRYPGFDVYLAHDLLGILPFKLGNYTALNEMDEVAGRMAEHRKSNFGGKAFYEYDDVPSHDTAPRPQDEDRGQAVAWKPGDPIPAGYRVGMNPFTKAQILFPKR